jgi:cell division septum initiation protein DivIVA
MAKRSNMPDIVERLGWWGAKATPPKDMPTVLDDIREAKAEIKRLRAELTAKEIVLRHAEAEIARLRAYIDGAIPNDEAGVQNLLAKTRNDALEEAAKVADDWEELSGKNLASLIRALKESGA